jgi:multicomponent K+:H+ antiporter subunit D
MLLVVFAVKAALLPLYFWLPATYAAAAAAVACAVRHLTKVGVYAIARPPRCCGVGRAWPGARPSLALALATLVLAAVGALAATRLRTPGGLSGGGLGRHAAAGRRPGQRAAALAAGLFYLVNSTLVAGLVPAGRPHRRARGGTTAWCRASCSRAGGYGRGLFRGGVAVAGVPPLAGFMGKALLLQAAGALPHGPAGGGGVLASAA